MWPGLAKQNAQGKLRGLNVVSIFILLSTWKVLEKKLSQEKNSPVWMKAIAEINFPHSYGPYTGGNRKQFISSFADTRYHFVLPFTALMNCQSKYKLYVKNLTVNLRNHPNVRILFSQHEQRDSSLGTFFCVFKNYASICKNRRTWNSAKKVFLRVA